MKGKWTLTLIYSKYAEVGEEYQTVEIEEPLEFHDFDDVANMLGYRAEGAPGVTRKFALKYEKEEE
jgi:hypothetical protein